MALLLAGLMHLPSADAGQEEQDLFPLVGQKVVRNSEGQAVEVVSLALHRSSRTLLALGYGPELYLLDPDTLDQVGTRELGTDFGDMIGIDEVKGRAFVSSSIVVRSVPFGPRITSPLISTVDLTANSPSRVYRFPAEFEGDGMQVEAITYYPAEDRVYAITQENPGGLVGDDIDDPRVTLHALVASRLGSADAEERANALIWSYDLTECHMLRSDSFKPGFLGRSSGGFLYTFCIAGPDTLGGILRINLSPTVGATDTSGFQTEFYPIGADLTQGFFSGDPRGDRILVASSAAGDQKLFVFNARERSWTGAAPLGTANLSGIALDQETGRTYITQQYDGVLVTETSQVPVGQGSLHVLRDANRAPIVLVAASGYPVFDPDTRRMFVKWPGDQRADRPTTLMVYEDRNPHPPTATKVNPDDSTHDIDEVLGRTPVTFSAEASAFGAHYLDVGADPDVGEMSAWAKQSQLSNSAAAAAAVRAASHGPSGVSDRSPESSCKDFGGEPDSASSNGSDASCDLDARSVSSSGTDEAGQDQDDPPIPSPFEVGSASVEVSLVLDERGILAESQAVARDVRVLAEQSGSAGVIEIGEIRQSAMAIAHGRPGTATSTQETLISDARVISSTGETYECAQCNPNALAEAINRLFSNRILAFVGGRALDPVVVGSPGGAQAAVIEDLHSQWSDFNVNHDTQQEVAALTIVIYRDTDRPVRDFLQLAGVRTEAHYAIGLPPVEPPPEPALLKIVLNDDSDPPNPLSGGTFEVYGDKDGNGVIDPLTDSVIQGGRCTTDEDGTGNCLFEELAAGDYVVHEAAAPGGYAPGPDTPVELLPGFAATATFINLPAIGFIDVSLTDDSQPPKPLSAGSFEVYADNGDLALGAGDQRLATCATNELGECMFNPKSVKGEAVVVECKRTQGSTKPDCTYDPDATEGNTLVVPLDTYIAREATAPGEYLPGEDRYETLASPYSQAHFRFVNGLKGIEGTPGTPAVSGSGGSTTPGTTVAVEEGTPSPQAKVTQQPREPSEPNILLRIIRLPADIWRFLQRHPLEALLFGLLWILLGLPLWLGHRRRLGWLVARSATY